MTTLHEAAKRVLDATEACVSEEGPEQHELDAARDALDALREALAAPEPEPVAWYVERVHPGKRDHGMKLGLFWRLEEAQGWCDANHELRCLYPAPPAAPAPAAPVVPLTDEQINEIASALFYVDEPAGSTVMRFRLQWLESIARPLARAIEAAHGIGGGNG